MTGSNHRRAGLEVVVFALASAFVLVLISTAPAAVAGGRDPAGAGPVAQAADGDDGGGVLAFLGTGVIVIAVAGLSTYAIRAAARRRESGPRDPGPGGSGAGKPGRTGAGPKTPASRKHNRPRRQRR